MNHMPALIQCRLGSHRLPAKALLPIGGMPSIVLAAKRAANTGRKVTVITSSDSSDDPLVDVLRQWEIPYFRGSLDHVLHRYVQATKDLKPTEYFIRLTGDNVVPDGQFLDQMETQCRAKSAHYLATQFPSSNLPYGLSAEVIQVGTLREAYRCAQSLVEKEHVTEWILRHGTQNVIFKGYEKTQGDFSGLRCTLDCFSDYLSLSQLFKGIEDPIGCAHLELCQRLMQIQPQRHCYFPYRKVNAHEAKCEFVLGTAQLGMPYGRANTQGQLDETQTRELLRRASEIGIQTLDTARAYGQSESRIGQYMGTQVFERPFEIQTKLSPDLPLNLNDVEHLNEIDNWVIASVLGSCQALQRHRLEVFMLHRWAHRFAFKGRIWQNLLKFKHDGTLKRLGVSVENCEQAIQALSDPDIEFIQFPFNLLDRRWLSQAFSDAVARRPDVVLQARSVLLQGILGAPGGVWPSMAMGQAHSIIDTLETSVKILGRKNRRDLCFAYVRSFPWVHHLVVGVDNLSQLEDNLHWFNQPPLDPEQRTLLHQSLPQGDNRLIDPSAWGQNVELVLGKEHP